MHLLLKQCKHNKGEDAEQLVPQQAANLAGHH